MFFMLSLISSCFAAEVETITVEPSHYKLLIFNLNPGDKFSGSLSITGGANDDIDFWITGPSGGTVLNLGRVYEGTSFEFTANEKGAYTLHFDNTMSLISSKIVTLSYTIEPAPVGISIPGFPIETILIGIILTAVALTVLRKKQLTALPSA